MDFYSLRLKYALEGNLNYIAWKDRMEALLEDNGLKKFIDRSYDVIFGVSWGNDVITFRDVMYVPGLKKNLVSIAMSEDRWYDVIFSKGKAFLCHIAMGKEKRIRILVNNIYKLEVEYCVSLSTKVEKVKSPDIGELWCKRLGY